MKARFNGKIHNAIMIIRYSSLKIKMSRFLVKLYDFSDGIPFVLW